MLSVAQDFFSSYEQNCYWGTLMHKYKWTSTANNNNNKKYSKNFNTNKYDHKNMCIHKIHPQIKQNRNRSTTHVHIHTHTHTSVRGGWGSYSSVGVASSLSPWAKPLMITAYLMKMSGTINESHQVSLLSYMEQD